jgi:hypothetical protein
MNMRTPRFLFTIIGFGSLTLGLSLAGEPSRQPSGQEPSENHTTSGRPADQAQGNGARDNRDQPDGKPSNSNAESHASEQSRQPGSASMAIPRNRLGQDHAKQVAIRHEDARNQRVDRSHTQRTPANDLQRPGANKAATVAKAGSMLNPLGNHRDQPARLPMGSGTIAPLPGVVRSRGAGTASVGGLAPSSAKSSAAVINGTGMGRRP